MDQDCKPSRPPRWRSLRGIGTLSRKVGLVSPPVSDNNRCSSFSTQDGSSASDQASASTRLLCERAITFGTEPEITVLRESECKRDAPLAEECLLEAKGLPFVRATTMRPVADICFAAINEEPSIIRKGYCTKREFRNSLRSLDDESILMPSIPTIFDQMDKIPLFRDGAAAPDSVAQQCTNSDAVMSPSQGFVFKEDLRQKGANIIPLEVSCERENSLGDLTLNSDDFGQSIWHSIVPGSLRLLPDHAANSTATTSFSKNEAVLQANSHREKPKRKGFPIPFSNAWPRKTSTVIVKPNAPRKATALVSDTSLVEKCAVLHSKPKIPSNTTGFASDNSWTREKDESFYISEKGEFDNTSAESMNALLLRMNNATASLESDSIISYLSLWKDLAGSVDEMPENSIGAQTHSLTRTTDESSSTKSRKSRAHTASDRIPSRSETVQGTVVSFPNNVAGVNADAGSAPSVTRIGSSTVINCRSGNLQLQTAGNLLKIEVTDALNPNEKQRIELPLDILGGSSVKRYASFKLFRETSNRGDSSVFSSETDILKTVQALAEECPVFVDLLINFKQCMNSIRKAFLSCRGDADPTTEDDPVMYGHTFRNIWDIIEQDAHEDVLVPSFEAGETYSIDSMNDEHLFLLRSYSEALSQIANSVKVMVEAEALQA